MRIFSFSIVLFIKMIVAAFLIFIILGDESFASIANQDIQNIKNEISTLFQNKLNHIWLVISTALVFLMQMGFMLLEAGISRSKNSINVAQKKYNRFSFIYNNFLSYWLLYNVWTYYWRMDWMGR